MSRFHGPLAVVTTLALAGCGSLDVPSTMAAHEICSGVFVSGFTADCIAAADVAPQLGPAAGLLRYRVDPAGRAVTASVGGLSPRRAAFHGPLGCIADQGVTPPRVAPLVPAPVVDDFAGAGIVTPSDPALANALDIAFAESESGPRRRTFAAVIVRDGRVVAERYAPGVGPATPLHGWSMTKSLTNALLGVLVRQGRLDMRAPAPVAEWRDHADPRRAITPEDLLRMRSGLDLGQSLYPKWDAAFDFANRTMFAAPDMAGAAVRRPLREPPATAWRYSDASTAILGRILRDVGGGGDPAAAQSFARRDLFDRLGMGPVTLETDAAGSPVAATQAYLSARDWARLGRLFRDDGVAAGERILPEGWVAWSTTPTPQSGSWRYGAGFWLIGGRPGIPADAYAARGARGQFMVIVPSRRMVIVKLGDADTPNGDAEAMRRVAAAATGS